MFLEEDKEVHKYRMLAMFVCCFTCSKTKINISITSFINDYHTLRRNGSIPRFIYGTPKWFYIELFFFW